jgi:hypothetical protein
MLNFCLDIKFLAGDNLPTGIFLPNTLTISFDEEYLAIYPL